MLQYILLCEELPYWVCVDLYLIRHPKQAKYALFTAWRVVGSDRDAREV